MPGLRTLRGAAPVPTGGRVRVVRAAVLGGTSLMLATGAHVLGGGSLPGPGVLLVASVLLGLLAALLTARRLRLPLLVGLLGAEQLALHELFRLAGVARACAPGALPPSTYATHGTHAAHAAHAAVGSTVPTCAAGDMVMASGAPAWVMTALHVVAVLATAWLLARGEAWLWRTVQRVVIAAGLALGHPAPRGSGDGQPVGRVPAVCRAALRSAAAPRGPPLLPAA
ncbi:hypothetical protein [Microlunatus spumicola]|uniref:hypothetical protein n=1 Tax=Microlunatus spumicola TaxID=81499 RepID=UPI00195E86D4